MSTETNETTPCPATVAAPCPRCGHLQVSGTFRTSPGEKSPLKPYRTEQRYPSGADILGYSDTIEMARAAACGYEDAVILFRADPPPELATGDGVWAWSTDEEHYDGSYDTPEEAFIAGHTDNAVEDDETVWVGQVTAPDPVRCLRAGPVIGQIRESLGDEAPDFCDNILPEPSDEQAAALETLLRNAYASWLALYPDQRPQWFTISGKVLEKTGAEIRELSAPET